MISEVAAIGCEVLESLGPGLVVHLSHAGVAHGLLALAEAGGVATPDLSEAVTAQGLSALASVAVPGVSALLNVALQPSANPALLANLSALASSLSPAIVDAASELSHIADALQGAGREVRIDLGMPADFEYYTGPVFTFRQGSREVGRGGRYELCGALGNHAAAGIGLDATAIAQLDNRSAGEALYVAVIPASPADYGRAMAVAKTLHRNDIPASLEEQRRGPLALRVHSETVELLVEGSTGQTGTLEELLPLLFRYK